MRPRPMTGMIKKKACRYQRSGNGTLAPKKIMEKILPTSYKSIS